MREHMRVGVKQVLLGMPLILLGRSKLMRKTLEPPKRVNISSLHPRAIYTRRYFPHVHTRYVHSCARLLVTP